jgi:hypothetical protein
MTTTRKLPSAADGRRIELASFDPLDAPHDPNHQEDAP